MKYAYEEQFRDASNIEIWTPKRSDVGRERQWSDERSWLDERLTQLRFKPEQLTVRLPSIAATRSFHVEVAAPDEMVIGSAVLAVKGREGRFEPSPGAYETGIDRTHLNVFGLPRGREGALLVDLSLHPSGVVTAMVLISFITFLLTGGGAAGHFFLGWHSSGDASAAVLLVLPGIFASYLIRPGEHRLIRRVVSGYKWQAAVLTVLSFLTAGSLVMRGDGGWRFWLWVGAGVVSGGSTLLAIINYWKADRCRKRRYSL